MEQVYVDFHFSDNIVFQYASKDLVCFICVQIDELNIGLLEYNYVHVQLWFKLYSFMLDIIAG